MFGSLLTLSRPYARAAFDFACEREVLEKWELMLVCAKKITENRIIKKLLFNVRNVDVFELSDVFISIGEHSFDCFFQNFIRIISRYNRLFLIPYILDQFLFFRRSYEMIVRIKVITVHALSDDQLFRIKSIMEKQLLCNVDIVCELDVSIIAGIVIYVNNMVIDGSMRGRIKRLKDVLVV